MNWILRIVALVITSFALVNAQTETTSADGAERIEEAVIPEAVPVETYRPIWENSPFQLEAPAPEVADAPSFAQQLALAGITKGGGTYFVHILDKNTGEYQTISDKAPKEGANSTGIRVLEIIENENPNLDKARITNGEEEAEIGFSKELVEGASKPPSRPNPRPEGQNPLRPGGLTGATNPQLQQINLRQQQPQNSQPVQPQPVPPKIILPQGGSPAPGGRPPQQQSDRIRVVVPSNGSQQN
ncbi:MAG: hypothetical protein AAF585_03760 [Verrucomicrobiota bacterium]